MSERHTAVTVIVTLLFVASVGGAFWVGKKQGYTAGKSVGQIETYFRMKNKHESNLNGQIKKAYIDGCAESVYTTLDMLGRPAQIEEAHQPCTEEVEARGLPYYSLD